MLSSGCGGGFYLYSTSMTFLFRRQSTPIRRATHAGSWYSSDGEFNVRHTPPVILISVFEDERTLFPWILAPLGTCGPVYLLLTEHMMYHHEETRPLISDKCCHT